MKVSGQLHSPATLLLVITLVPILQDVRWASELVQLPWRKEKYLASTMNQIIIDKSIALLQY
jgi:hypothetical protein